MQHSDTFARRQKTPDLTEAEVKRSAMGCQLSDLKFQDLVTEVNQNINQLLIFYDKTESAS